MPPFGYNVLGAVTCAGNYGGGGEEEDEISGLVGGRWLAQAKRAWRCPLANSICKGKKRKRDL